MAPTALTNIVRTLRRSLSVALTWRNIAILFAVLNLKVLPLVWHLRIFQQLVRNLASRTTFVRPSTTIATWTSPTHAIFTPHTLRTHNPLLETDYNLHKSNSTYFADLDVSRTALVTRLLSHPFSRRGGPVLKELYDEGHRGRMMVILGSVHCSFRKEVGMYERYEVRSRVLGWDEKWLVIGSWFVRVGKGKGKGEGEVLASALSKYVFKKGRFTVRPERLLRNAGLLPERVEAGPEVQVREDGEMGESKWEDVAKGNHNEDGNANGEGVTAATLPDAALEGTDKALASAGKNQDGLLSQATADAWDWARVEKERAHGMEVAKRWMTLDGELLEEYPRLPGS